VNDPSHVLLVAGLLSAAALGIFAAQIERLDSATPERLIAQMRLAQFAAVLLAAMSGITCGLVLGSGSGPFTTLDTCLFAIFGGLSALVVRREPRPALLLAAAGLVAHGFVTIAHRPGWMPTAPFSQWHAVGLAVYDLAIAMICVWTWRR
jgi:hypothetical protein